MINVERLKTEIEARNVCVQFERWRGESRGDLNTITSQLTALNDINEPSQVKQQNEIMVVSVH